MSSRAIGNIGAALVLAGVAAVVAPFEYFGRAAAQDADAGPSVLVLIDGQVYRATPLEGPAGARVAGVDPLPVPGPAPTPAPTLAEAAAAYMRSIPDYHRTMAIVMRSQTNYPTQESRMMDVAQRARERGAGPMGAALGAALRQSGGIDRMGRITDPGKVADVWAAAAAALEAQLVPAPSPSPAQSSYP